jgi:secondary thiamine-phosphate synthase enzyme
MVGEKLVSLIQRQETFAFNTGRGAGLYDFTSDVQAWLREERLGTGQINLFCQHTAASLIIQENVDPDVQADLLSFFRRLVPDGPDGYIHTLEGPDDMPAHIKTALTASQLTVPVNKGRLMLGTWQGIYLFEHRTSPHRRSVVFHFIGEEL